MMSLTDKDSARSKRDAPASFAVPVSVSSSTMHTRGSSTQQNDPIEEHSDSAEDVDKSISKGGVTTPFPWKLHEMLDDMAENNDNAVVCWQPHGRAFMVHSTKEFVNRIMPNYFNQTKYASFQRQLNLYGFSRLSHGKDKGAYFHPCFVRGQRNLCRNMIRQKIKGTKVRRSLSADEEPNFYDPQQYQDKSRPTTMSAPPVTPEVQKTTKSRTSPSRVWSNKMRKKEDIQPSTASSPATQPIQTSLVSLMREGAPADRTALPVLPPPPVIRQLYTLPSDPTKSLQHLYHAGASSAVKGGDLLYFEGQPFRYLEHIDEVPSLPPASSTLHDMISSIVKMENQWPQAAPRRQTGQELYSR
ncbi:unnamed protein product [Cylindrotheca closterium]|uniref:HSF-type DNA-binding domain-containing protein n=1 Tax=Cylindrotheca closterium TaxID=2856 RepID=A0AAD2PV21_9STRA|nr:unnamed protein product [Cylindrotheca closterium]